MAILSPSTKDAALLYATYPPAILPSRLSSLHFSDVQTGLEKGSDLAKPHTSDGVQSRIQPLDSEDSVHSTVLGSLSGKQRSLKMVCVALKGSEFPITEGDHLSRIPQKGFNRSSSADLRSEALRLWNHMPPS